MTIHELLKKHTNWKLLTQQKLALVDTGGAHITKDQALLDGLFNWIEALQIAAEEEGYPVVWLEDEES